MINTFIQAQSLSTLLTQGGGTTHSIFLNPAQLSSQNNTFEMNVNILNTSVNLSQESYNFLQELNSATSASNKNREISQLLKKNIGKKLNFSAYNFSSISQNQEKFSWSLGIVDSIDGYFITHSGFGSKGAMESLIETYKAFITTLSIKQGNMAYGVNIKAMEKQHTIHNYSINEMIKNSNFSDYFDNKNSKKVRTLGVDTGIVYTLPNHTFTPKLSFSVLNIGNSSFKNLDTLPSTSNISCSIRPYTNTFVQFDYLDLFKHQKNQELKDSFRAYLSQDFFHKTLKLNSGLLYNALTLGAEYHYSFLTLSLESYKTKIYNQGEERRYSLSIALSW